MPEKRMQLDLRLFYPQNVYSMNYPASELRGIKKHNDVIPAVLKPESNSSMKRLWIPAQKIAGMTNKGV
jgi:hypothetical protein